VPGAMLRVSEDFWNIRGSHRIGGLIDVGTQASLVRRANGRFIFLDSYTLTSRVSREVDELTGGGERVEAILNLHPFHTVHVRKMHELFPRARLHGTARHLERLPELPWEEARTEDSSLHGEFADAFDFSVPRGVDFISADEKVHFSSVLAFHRASRTIHSDDTLMYFRLSAALSLLGLSDAVSFHPTLAKALEQRPGAARDFRKWARQMIESWRGAENLCAAHTASLLARENRGESIHDRLRRALEKVDKTLQAHQRKYG